MGQRTDGGSWTRRRRIGRDYDATKMGNEEFGMRQKEAWKLKAHFSTFFLKSHHVCT